MGQDPKEMWRKLQQTMNSAQQKGRGGLPGGPRNFFGGAVGLLLLGTGVVVVNNALFNGTQDLELYHDIERRTWLIFSSGWRSSSHQVHKDRWCTERDIQ